MKKILFIGLGSIGQRHLRNLKLINKKLQFYAIRKKKNSPLLDKNNSVISSRFNCEDNNVKEINLNQAKKINFYIVFVCNPSSLHLKYSFLFLKKNTALFIEKPISHNFYRINIFKKEIEKKKIICGIGYQLRYEKILYKIKKLIDTNALGKIKKVNIKNRHFLPYHHRYEDYRTGYAANKSLGGGVLLCFIHEIDYAIYLFGTPKSLRCSLNKKSDLQMDVEDTAKLTLYYNDHETFNINMTLDFIKKHEERFLKIKFEKGWIFWDLKVNTLKINYNSEKQEVKFQSHRKRDTLFTKQLRSFLKSVQRKKQPVSNYTNGIESLKLVTLAKKSSKLEKTINL